MKQAIVSMLPPGHPWREYVHYFDSIDSTNTYAKTLARQGAPHGSSVLAGSQSAGRGRLGRSFHSPSGTGIYLSVILRPECSPQELMHLTCAVGSAMCNAVEAVCGIRPGIKWINDLVLQQRKIGGILTELGFTCDGRVDYAVVGIGINCDQCREDFPEELHSIASSLRAVTGQTVDIPSLAAAMLISLEEMSHKLLTQKATIMDRYRSDCITLGKSVQLHGQRTGNAFALDVDDDGGLIVRLEDGTVHSVQSGEVSVRGLYTYV